MTTDCKRIGIERCGLDVKCAACTKEHHPSGYSAEYVEQLARGGGAGMNESLFEGADPGGVLTFLRWEADCQIVNHFGEHVWLKQVYDDAGQPSHITDCCFVDAPCEYHASTPRVQA